MMFSSSCNNNNGDGDSDYFGAYDGSISSSSFQVGSSFISTPANLLEDDQYFFLDQLLSMSQGQQQQQFSLGYDTDPVQLALTDYNNNDFLDGMMLVAGKDQISCDIEEVEEVAPSHTKAIIDSSSNGGEICRNYCDKPAVKRSPAKRIRSGKKDRHSKICTAQGPRDRRMRLSLQVARKFFDLQDKLRFDRASKTIEWLFHMSKNAIKEVMASRIMNLKNNLESSLCENEEGFSSKFDHITTNFEDTDRDKFKIRINKQHRSTSKKSKRNEEAHCPQLKKDVRDKARAWARDRTVEKMRLRALNYPSQGLLTTLGKAAAAANPSNNHSYYSEQIGSCSAFGFEHLDSGAQSQYMEELIHSDLKIDNARFYSRMF